ncbi:MAG: polyphosphate polymerase domain-containing protein, partial [Eubacteriales bacterium]|nr:polyphosphate polymerase domain-containing protein [Eubacteriales bacterium]
MNGTFRHEQKYFINMQDAALLRARLLPVIKKDEHAGEKGEYWIRSLYFDDCRSSAYEEKDMGIMSRKKYRIRVYECSDKIIRLERKNKVGPYINKQSAPLTRDETEKILAGDYEFMRDSGHQLLREFYFECISNIMRPRVIVDYDREPFVLTEGDVRITFDKHIRAGLGGV